ncbi:peptidyl-glycine alpha-amidating monooxygenase A-like [Haliotis rubra]|uniref:peptidyl-glycine alpha-amidating monooxygenase A-like n=1 Tax=Haliotis rubra TaxID=36100 RepID=UPI001EE54890|nr:peptidyl-glycine alpha-amidating monooxygenase A-like [Haliotis rubra]
MPLGMKIFYSATMPLGMKIFYSGTMPLGMKIFYSGGNLHILSETEQLKAYLTFNGGVIRSTQSSTDAAMIDECKQMSSIIILLANEGAHPSTADVHLCSSYTTHPWLLGEAEYIVKFEVLAKNSSAHHMSLYGCGGEPARNADVWKCPGVCQQGVSEVFLFTWAHGAPSTSLPDDVGFKVGRGTGIQTLVLQTHYPHSFNESAPTDFSGIRIYVTSERQTYAAGVYLLESIRFTIPPNTANAHVDVSCTYHEPHPMYPFAYRTHSHGLGKVITGYLFNHTWHEIGKGNSLGPQTFYPVSGSYIVKSGDELVARCTYDSRGRDTVTNTGRKESEEMCKFYMMYYTNPAWTYLRGTV